MERLTDWIVLVLAGLAVFLLTEDLLAADRHQVWAELGAGWNGSFFQQVERYQWEDQSSPGFIGSLSYEFHPERNDRIVFVAQYVHVSQWFVGPPFNSRGESSLDHVGIAVRWRLNK